MISNFCHRWVLLLLLTSCAATQAQEPWTWEKVRARFEHSNPTLQADGFNVDESKAQEITAYLRPNPNFTLLTDGTQIAPYQGVWRPFAGTELSTNFSYLHERQRKRELRRESAHKGTEIAVSTHADLERSLLFDLRGAFVSTLQAKSVLRLARDNLTYYDHLLEVSRDRFSAGDMAQMDLDRLELQRVQYESDVQTAEVNLRTAKIQLLRLMNDQTTPVDQFDVSGPFDFIAPAQSLDECRRIAFDVRPDLRAALQAIDKAKTDNRLAFANGSIDPTIAVDAGFPSVSQVWQSYQPPLREYVGISVGLPLRNFDRNQGEKLRTRRDITRNERLADAARLQVFGDVDTAYATVMSAVTLLQPYRSRYLDQATRVRDTITFSYQRGGASLIDFVQAQQEYRAVQVSFVNLIGAFLN